jgi:hypothetical protein
MLEELPLGTEDRMVRVENGMTTPCLIFPWRKDENI